ncbi:MAG: T9SS type A sorting domain-containing protein [Paraprevotella sp.]|nr:T9SS type A sorting domain-containing protein [Paraprevotella sp.]
MNNKVKSMLTALLFCAVAPSWAQVDNTFCFVDANGNTLADGSTVNATEIEVDPFEGFAMIPTGLSVKNTTGEEAYISADVIVNSLANGSFQVCFPMECRSGITSSFTTDCGSMSAGETKSLQTEWIPANADSYGKSTITFKLKVMTRSGKFPNYKYTFKADGPEVTVNCIYADPTGINEVSDATHAIVNVYDITGKTILKGADKASLATLGKGIYIYETVKGGKATNRKKIIR